MLLFDQLADILRNGERVALATITTAQGSTPRSVGTRMVIRRDGNHIGTIGGGCSEAQVIRAGLTALDIGTPCHARIDLTAEVTLDSDMVCGGILDVLIVPWDDDLLPVIDTITRAVGARHGFRLLTCLGGPFEGGMICIAEQYTTYAGLDDDTARRISELTGNTSHNLDTLSTGSRLDVLLDEEKSVFLFEKFEPLPFLLICGGGHIARPLCIIGKTLGFEVTVIDDRPTFADTQRFPKADHVICGPFVETLAGLPLDPETYSVVVTRGHRHDLECVRHLIKYPLGYLGMIGSRRRVEGLKDLLHQEGVDSERLSHLHAPVGLDIGAETPEEIALAILAEITQKRRGGSGKPLSFVANPRDEE